MSNSEPMAVTLPLSSHSKKHLKIQVKIRLLLEKSVIQLGL